MIGLAGAHRTGKTTLAKAYAEKYEYEFAQTSVSAIFRDLGHDPSESFDFKTRLSIQEQILIRMTRFYREVSNQRVITDRTPIDFMGYTLAEAVGETVQPEDQERLVRYMNDCFEVTNRFFSEIVVVQPGIPLVEEEGKAALNKGYIEHLNNLIIGLCCDERLKIAHFYIPRSRVELEARVLSIESTKQRVMDRMLTTDPGESRVFH